MQRFGYLGGIEPLSEKSVFLPLWNVLNFWYPKIGEKMTKYGTPPIFSPEIFFTKMTQNGLKWILNTTFKNVTFCRRGNVTFVTIFFFLKASLRNQWSLIWRSNRTMTLSYPVVSELRDQGKRRNICIIFPDIPSLKSGSLLFPHISWFQCVISWF